MTTRLLKLDSFPPGYRVEVDGAHAGDVFKTGHPMYPTVAHWYSYLPEQDFPLDPELTRREAVAKLVDALARPIPSTESEGEKP